MHISKRSLLSLDLVADTSYNVYVRHSKKTHQNLKDTLQ